MKRRAFFGSLAALTAAPVALAIGDSSPSASAGDEVVVTVNGVQYRGPLTPVDPVATATPTVSPTATATPILAPTPAGLTRYSVANYSNVSAAFADIKNRHPGGGFELYIPPGTHTHSGILEFAGMRDISIYGEGTLLATNFGAATLRIKDCDGVVLDGFAVAHNNPTTRLNGPESTGIHLHGSRNVTLRGLRVSKTACAGIWSEPLGATFCEGLLYENVEVRDTLADGIHNTNGCKDVTLEGCRAYNTFDDSFSAINYSDSPRLIENYWAKNCYAESNGTGVGGHFAIEGARDSGLVRPVSWRAPGAPIQIASEPNFSRQRNERITVTGGELYDGRQGTVGHPGGILIFAGSADINSTIIDGTKIIRPNNWAGIQITQGGSNRVRNTTIKNVALDRQGNMICDEFLSRGVAVNLTGSGNTMDGQPVAI